MRYSVKPRLLNRLPLRYVLISTCQVLSTNVKNKYSRLRKNLVEDVVQHFKDDIIKKNNCFAENISKPLTVEKTP